LAKVIICDPIHEDGVKMLRDAGLDVTLDTEVTAEELLKKISEYDAMVIRSRTKVTKELTQPQGNRPSGSRLGQCRPTLR